MLPDRKFKLLAVFIIFCENHWSNEFDDCRFFSDFTVSYMLALATFPSKNHFSVADAAFQKFCEG